MLTNSMSSHSDLTIFSCGGAAATACCQVANMAWLCKLQGGTMNGCNKVLNGNKAGVASGATNGALPLPPAR